jgi:hypothetical protein
MNKVIPKNPTLLGLSLKALLVHPEFMVQGSAHV